MTIEQDYLTSDQAIYIFNAISCTVKLNISLGEYKTRIGTSFDLVYIEELNEWTHVHNIVSILDEEKKIFIPIDWSK